MRKGKKQHYFCKQLQNSGDFVRKGEVLATLYINDTSDYSDVNNIFDIK